MYFDSKVNANAYPDIVQNVKESHDELIKQVCSWLLSVHFFMIYHVNIVLYLQNNAVNLQCCSQVVKQVRIVWLPTIIEQDIAKNFPNVINYTSILGKGLGIIPDYSRI